MNNEKFPVPMEEPNHLGRKVRLHKPFYKVLSVFVYSVLLEASPIWLVGWLFLGLTAL